MKFLEGKTPAERKKVITAVALGLLALVALSYTFLFSGSTKTPKKNPEVADKKPTLSGTPLPGPPSTDDILLTEIPDNPFPDLGSPEAARNIFAFYEPPVRPPVQNVPIVEKPTATPTPAPTPPLLLMHVNPANVFARTGDFTLEVGGDKFTPESKILFNGMEVSTQFSSPQRLTAQISAQLVSGEGERQITVRTPDGKLFSNPLTFNVQAPPVPNFEYVGLVARKRFNNDTAMLQNKDTKEYISVRLNDPVPDRFRVTSISNREVIVVDTALKLQHRLAFVEEKGRSGGGGAPLNSTQPIRGRVGGNVVVTPQGFDPNVQPIQGEIPGIPNNIPRYVPPQPPPQQQQNPSKKREDDDDDNDPNFR